MNAPEYSLFFAENYKPKHARRWLILGVLALGVAGIFAGLLANTKSAYFYTALVVHVDLSVLVWFLTIACMFFTLAVRDGGYPMLADAAFGCFSAGAALIALSAFTGGEAYMSNYIPVIHYPLFFLGLSLVLCGVLGSAVNLLINTSFKAIARNAPLFGVVSAAIIMLGAIACFIISVRSLPSDMKGQVYYEYAFWGGGHLLQFVHTQLMIVAWLWLAGASGLRVKLGHRAIQLLYGLGIIATVAAFFIYTAHDATTDEHRFSFTALMKHLNGLAALVVGAFIACALAKTPWDKESKLLRITLIMSILLFAAGGGLGYMIAGSNVTVPAHYHGSIVGITLAFMGMAYLLLPSFGFADVSQSRLAFFQPVIYGGGQLCWMLGMAFLGAHGVPRKTPGSADTVGIFASTLKHSGDGLALIGGLLFVFVVLRAVCKKPAETI